MSTRLYGPVLFNVSSSSDAFPAVLPVFSVFPTAYR